MPGSLERRDLPMACGDAGRFANAENLLSQSARFLLDAGEARALIDAMQAADLTSGAAHKPEND